MERYRLYGQTDDQPKVVGDEHFLGVDEYSNPENVQPAYVQKAVNLAFNTMNAETRGGFVCLPELGNLQPGQYWSVAANPSYNESSPTAFYWNDIAYGNGCFVAVGTVGGVSSISKSIDGKNWQNINVPTSFDGAFYAITWSGSQFVAIGGGATSGNKVLTSPNGNDWSVQTGITPIGGVGGAWNGVSYGNSTYVAVGLAQGSPLKGVQTSSDAITWTQRNQTIAGEFADVTFGSNLFVSVGVNALGTAGVITTSPDGITWTSRTVPAGISALRAVTYGNGRFVAVGTATTPSDDRIVSSTDGITWTLQTSSDEIEALEDVTYGNGQFLAVGRTYGESAVYTSPDGVTWAYQSSIFSPDIEISATCVAAGLIDDREGFAVAGSWNSLFTINTKFQFAYSSGTIWASGVYSDPDSIGQQWIMLVRTNSVDFYQFGQNSRSISLGSYYVSEQSTIVQCNNLVYLFRGDDQTPLYWSGDWNTSFVEVPATALPATFNSIPNSNQATYYQNRLWVRDGKDEVAASDVLAFTDYDPLTNEFNLNTGNSDYVVATFPFGQNSLICFKNKSIELMQNVQGSLSDVTVTEITRQVGLVGINAVTSVGPDLAYVSYGNINLLTLTSTNNAMQHKTLPLSSRIRKIMDRVNWDVGYKISLGYWNNKLYVALPLDNSQFCNSVVVYNFITESWYGEWAFDSSINMCVQGWAVLDYIGLQRLHAVTEDGRIFVTDEGQNDISGATVAEISTDMLTRAYATPGNSSSFSANHFQRRMFVDVATNRPKFSISSYTEGASEQTVLVTDQTYTRSQSWKFNDSAYDLTNANNDYNRAYRKDYSTGPASVQTGTGFQPEMTQDYRMPVLTNRAGRLSWLQISNTQGYMMVKSIGLENRLGQRGSTVQV